MREMTPNEKIQSEIEAKMTQMNQTLNELKQKAERRKDKFDSDQRQTLAAIEEKHRRIDAKLKEFSQSRESDRSGLAEDLKTFMSDMDDEMRRALVYFK